MNYLTVEEVATYLQLSAMMVYKLAQQGKIPAKKIGRVWRFSRAAIDEWMGAGAMRETAQPNGQVQAILTDFVRTVRARLGRRLRHVVLFGSQARGDADPESDIDLLIVLDTVREIDRKHISDVAYAVTYGSDRFRLLAEVVIDEPTYLTSSEPLLMNIRREGKMAA